MNRSRISLSYRLTAIIPGPVAATRSEASELNPKKTLSITITSVFLCLPALADSPDDVLAPMVERLAKGGESAYSYVLRQYNRVESAKRLDVFGRHEVHKGLLKALRTRVDKDLLSVVRGLIKKTLSSVYPSQVLGLKAFAGSGAGGDLKSGILELYTEATRSKDRGIQTWAVRLLVDSGWPEAIDVLITRLREEEDMGRHLEDLASVIQSELYRALGAAGVGDAGAVKKRWDDMGKELPDEPNYDPKAVSGGGNTVFFGDRIALRAIFCIDISSSMNGQVKMPGQGSSPKVEIVKAELGKAVGGLSRESLFTIIPYDGTARSWRGRGKLQPGTRTNVLAAEGFARRLQTGKGTNIHDSLVLALKVKGVETIYLLSDGAPSRGGGPEEIKKRVAALNYLLGVRVVTYGFTGSDEKLMKDLAGRNWGWYRALNKARKKK